MGAIAGCECDFIYDGGKLGQKSLPEVKWDGLAAAV